MYAIVYAKVHVPADVSKSMWMFGNQRYFFGPKIDEDESKEESSQQGSHKFWDTICDGLVQMATKSV